MRKTNDEEILRLLKEGKNQKEVAKYFNVSPAAICKRVKRLQPIEEPESFKNLSQKEKKFALEIIGGKTQLDAALASHDCTSRESAKAMGYQLMQKNDIKRAIEEVLQECGLTKRYRIEKLKTHVDAKDPGISLKALDQTHKLARDYPPENTLLIQPVVTYADLTKSRKDLEEEIRVEKAKLGMDVIEGEIVEEDTEETEEKEDTEDIKKEGTKLR